MSKTTIEFLDNGTEVKIDNEFLNVDGEKVTIESYMYEVKYTVKLDDGSYVTVHPEEFEVVDDGNQ